MGALQIANNDRPQGVQPNAEVVIQLDNGKKLTISAQEINTFLEIVRVVSDNPRMQLMIGKPGSHAFKVMHTDCIVVDPLLIKQSPQMARFVTGHEAAHEISRSMLELGLSVAQSDKLGKAVGCMYIHNAIEDPAVNNYMCIRAPNLKPDMTAVYDKMLEKENAPMVAHDAVLVAQLLGRIPRYVQYGSELIRYWHHGYFSSNLDPDVRLALHQTLDKVLEVYNTIPLDGSSDKQIVVDCARRRFLLVHEYVWPHVQNLIQLDIQDQRRQNQLDDIARNQSAGNGSTGRSGSGQQTQSNDSISDETKNEIGKALSQSNNAKNQQISDELRKLAEEINKAKGQEKASDQPDKSGTKGSSTESNQPKNGGEKDSAVTDSGNSEQTQNTEQKKSGSKSGDQKANDDAQDTAGKDTKDSASRQSGNTEQKKSENKSGEQPIEDGTQNSDEDRPKDNAKDTNGKLDQSDNCNTEERPNSSNESGQKKTSSEDLQNELKRKVRDITNSEEAAKELEDEILKGNQDAIDQALKNQNSSDASNIKWDDLSDKAKAEIERAFERLSLEEQIEAIREAEKILKQAEDKLNAKLNPKETSNPDLRSNDKPQVSSNQTPNLNNQKQINFSSVNNAVSQLANERMAQLSKWDLEYERVSQNIDQMYRRILERVLLHRYPDWQSGYLIGQELDTFTAMQAEQDPRLLTQMYKIRALPTELDWSVEIIVDTSPSMVHAAEPQFQAVVFLTELLERLKLEYQAGEFSGGVFWHKKWQDKLDDPKVKEELSKILACSGGTTHDGEALEDAYNQIQENKSAYKMIVLFSDAESMQADKLIEVVKRIRDEGNTILVHYGVGPSTKDTYRFYPVSYGDLVIDGDPVDFIRSSALQPSLEQLQGEAYAMQMAIGQETNSKGPDFYHTFFESIVDILTHPELYLRHAKLHEPAKRFNIKES